jgi:hypothetical protein
MVLPLLFSLGLPALAGTGALGATMAGLSAPVLSGLGAGLGSLIQTGDIGDGIKTGLTSFLGARVLGGITGGAGYGKDTTALERVMSGPMGVQEAQQALIAQGGSPFLSSLPVGTEGGFLGTAGLQGAAAGAMLPGTLSGAMMGQTMSDAYAMNRSAQGDDDSNPPPMPRPPIRTYSSDPYAGGGGEGLYFQYQRPPMPVDYQPQYPYYYAGGGLMDLQYMQEGGEVEMEADEIMMANGMNEKDVIVQAIEAIKGMSEQPEIDLALFVQKYGEDALRDLVGRVQSGELDDTVARFEEGEKGMVRGPGDGSGVDDMVPATLEGEQDVLLSDGEFVLRKKTTDALEKAYGGGFLDIVNRAEEEAPELLEQMVG